MFQAPNAALTDRGSAFALVLRPFEAGRPLHIVCDASDVGCGYAAEQWVQGEAPRIVALGSHRFNETQVRWAVRERECYAIVFALTQLDVVARSASELHVWTDHHSLQWLWREQTGKLGRWAVFLQDYDYSPLSKRSGERNCRLHLPAHCRGTRRGRTLG